MQLASMQRHTLLLWYRYAHINAVPLTLWLDLLSAKKPRLVIKSQHFSSLTVRAFTCQAIVVQLRPRATGGRGCTRMCQAVFPEVLVRHLKQGFSNPMPSSQGLPTSLHVVHVAHHLCGYHLPCGHPAKSYCASSGLYTKFVGL